MLAGGFRRRCSFCCCCLRHRTDSSKTNERPTHVFRTCIRRENAAVPAAKVKTLEVFMRRFSSSPACPARSLSGSLGGLDHGSGRYLLGCKRKGRGGEGKEGDIVWRGIVTKELAVFVVLGKHAPPPPPRRMNRHVEKGRHGEGDREGRFGYPMPPKDLIHQLLLCGHLCGQLGKNKRRMLHSALYPLHPRVGVGHLDCSKLPGHCAASRTDYSSRRYAKGPGCPGSRGTNCERPRAWTPPVPAKGKD